MGVNSSILSGIQMHFTREKLVFSLMVITKKVKVRKARSYFFRGEIAAKQMPAVSESNRNCRVTRWSSAQI